MTKRLVLDGHRRLALVAGLAILIWACSGLLHPLMSWTNPQPAVFTPPVEDLPQMPAGDLKGLLQGHGITAIRGARFIASRLGAVVQVTVPEAAQRRYFHWPDGAEQPQRDREHAENLARYYGGERTAAITSAKLVTQFDSAYPAVNRLLPVSCAVRS